MINLKLEQNYYIIKNIIDYHIKTKNVTIIRIVPKENYN